MTYGVRHIIYFWLFCWFPYGSVVGSQALVVRGELPYEALSNARVVVIKSSPGGTGAAAMALSHVQTVVIDGPCISACAWGAMWNANACFMDRASLRFHVPRMPGTGEVAQGVLRDWIATLPAQIKTKVSQRLLATSWADVNPSVLHRPCQKIGL